jgi:transcriptional regulator with XRE-family HTH domain
MTEDNASTHMKSLPISSTMTLKKQLRIYLDHYGITAAQLSRKSGVPKQSISGWLSGNNPRDVRQLKKVADSFKTTVDVLMFGAGISEEEKASASLDALLGDEWLSGQFEIRIRRLKKEVK